ncbi:Uma2 family endonuclease [Sinosporangium siamense]|uniref:Putative restriction endonuclease domain-containing protein n=1 Tax=Sinosporangium siamense TaxID=1367973 RepID=A0A919V2H1_9ACTN|nr:Uma2 family endonuclease [Sinosporangium siamense]GII89910.1 hypothetical protein Ssi02_01410 [Sinosporangium siamense]
MPSIPRPPVGPPGLPNAAVLPSPWRTPGVLSVEEWLRLNERSGDGSRYELIDGSLILSPPTGFIHRCVGAGLQTVLRAAAPEELIVTSSVGLMLDGSPGAFPDLLVLDRAAFAASGTPPPPVARPEWVKLAIEVISDPHRIVDRLLKPAKYAEVGIPAFWRVETHPFRGQGGDELPIIFTYTLGDEGYRLTHRSSAGSVVEETIPFPVRFDPGALRAP